MANFLTQCPFCQTSFKVSDEHMQAANGVVRCGSCMEFFLADQNRISLREHREYRKNNNKEHKEQSESTESQIREQSPADNSSLESVAQDTPVSETQAPEQEGIPLFTMEPDVDELYAANNPTLNETAFVAEDSADDNSELTETNSFEEPSTPFISWETFDTVEEGTQQSEKNDVTESAQQESTEETAVSFKEQVFSTEIDGESAEQGEEDKEGKEDTNDAQTPQQTSPSLTEDILSPPVTDQTKADPEQKRPGEFSAFLNPAAYKVKTIDFSFKLSPEDNRFVADSPEQTLAQDDCQTVILENPEPDQEMDFTETAEVLPGSDPQQGYADDQPATEYSDSDSIPTHPIDPDTDTGTDISREDDDQTIEEKEPATSASSIEMTAAQVAATAEESTIPTLAPDFVASEHIPVSQQRRAVAWSPVLTKALPPQDGTPLFGNIPFQADTEKAFIHNNLSTLRDHDSLLPLPRENLEAINEEPVELTSSHDPLKKMKTLALVVASLLLILSLAGQYAWFNLESLLEDERFDPFTARVCNFVDCPDTSLIDLTALITEELLIRSHPSLPDALLVNFIFRNDAAREQEFPLVELNFTNNNGTIVANRVFTPLEYLPSEMHLFTHMPAHSSIQVSLELVDPGDDATGYSLVFRNP